MARYEHLKIYKTTFDFMVYFTKIMGNFQKDYKHTLAQRILDAMSNAILDIYKINDTQNNTVRLERIENFCEKLECVNLHIRLAHSVRAMNTAKYKNCCTFICDIEKQVTGWKKYIITKLEAQNNQDPNSQTKDNEQIQG